MTAAERVLSGDCLYFSRHWLKRPHDWRSNPHTGYSSPAVHWSLLPDFDPRQGDIKWIWEPSRFDWLYVLGRAWSITCDNRYAEGIWNLLDDWRRHNPPETGINWKCGQECSFRLFALVWGAGILRESETATPDRMARLWETVFELARRIYAAIGYALSQNNNHGLSEAAALYLAGSCLAGHPSAPAWRNKGRRLFAHLVRNQFAPDGAYVQNSVNYERVALRDAFVVLFAAQKFGDMLPDDLRPRLRQAVNFLYEHQDENSGRLPLYGPNDGSNIMSLSSSDYLDFRPVLQAMNYLLTGECLYPPGPFDEEIWWHFGVTKSETPVTCPAKGSFAAPQSGYYFLENGPFRGFIRCHTHRTRPGDADMLHLDLWRRGVNIACDSGTYQYFDVHSWGDYLKSTAAHNTVTVDGRNQMPKLGRFLWGDWTRSRVVTGKVPGRYLLWSGEHYGYGDGRQGVVHRRTVHGCEGEWVVQDELLGKAGQCREFTLYWHLAGTGDWTRHPAGAYSAELGVGFFIYATSEAEITVLQGAEHYPSTGQSLYYGELSPITLLKATCRHDAPLRFLTHIGPECIAPRSNIVTWKGERFSL